MNTKLNIEVFNKFPEMESSRLKFREFKEEDKDDIYQIRSDAKVAEMMNSYRMEYIKDAENLAKSVIESFKKKRSLTWAITEKKSGKFIGYFSFYRFANDTCGTEIAYALKPEFWGKGFMRETFNLMIPFAFKELQVNYIEADVNPKNRRSILLLHSAGFKRESAYSEKYYIKSLFFNFAVFVLHSFDTVSVDELENKSFHSS